MPLNINDVNYGANQNEERLKNFLNQLSENQRSQANLEAARQMKEAELGQARTLKEAEMGLQREHYGNEDKEKQRQIRFELTKLLMGQNGGQLGSDEQKRQTLTNEGLEAVERADKTGKENPGAFKAVTAAESAKGIPVIGGMTHDAIVGLASLFNPAAKQLDADRTKLVSNMGYLKSGANVAEREERAIGNTLPGAAQTPEQASDLYGQFKKPFLDTAAMNASKGAPKSTDVDAMTKYVMSGGSMPAPNRARQPLGAQSPASAGPTPQQTQQTAVTAPKRKVSGDELNQYAVKHGIDADSAKTYLKSQGYATD